MSLAATIDIGSNTLRLLIGTSTSDGTIDAKLYERRITRLAGGIDNSLGLHPDSMQRTLDGLIQFRSIIDQHQVDQVRAVATAAMRRAVNSAEFILQVKERCGIDIDIISGKEEAQLTSSGVLSVIDPLPEQALIIDIGGGSTEFVALSAGQVLFEKSYTMGTVQLCEELSDDVQRGIYIAAVIDRLLKDMQQVGCSDISPVLIGTAGTITTLAAIDLELQEYNAARINNHHLKEAALKQMMTRLAALSAKERERLPGMEAGRGDLIVPGLQIVLQLLDRLKQQGKQHGMIVSDAGLLEGTLLNLASNKGK